MIFEICQRCIWHTAKCSPNFTCLAAVITEISACNQMEKANIPLSRQCMAWKREKWAKKYTKTVWKMENLNENLPASSFGPNNFIICEQFEYVCLSLSVPCPSVCVCMCVWMRVTGTETVIAWWCFLRCHQLVVCSLRLDYCRAELTLGPARAERISHFPHKPPEAYPQRIASQAIWPHLFSIPKKKSTRKKQIIIRHLDISIFSLRGVVCLLLCALSHS